MVELIEIGGIVVEGEAMDEAGIEVGGVKHVAHGIDRPGRRYLARCWRRPSAGVGKRGDGSGRAVDLPDRPGIAAGQSAELSFHELRVRRTGFEPNRTAVGVRLGRHDLQAIGGGRGRVKVRRTAVLAGVESEREDLADVLGLDRQLHRGRDRAALRRTAKRGKIEHGKRRRVDVDDRLIDGRNSRRQTLKREHRSGEAGYGAVARRKAECSIGKTRIDCRRKQAKEGQRQPQRIQW